MIALWCDSLFFRSGKIPFGVVKRFRQVKIVRFLIDDNNVTG